MAALEEAHVNFGSLDGVAATAGPGLIGGLLVGLVTAKAIALVHDLPLIAVNHLEAHALTAGLTEGLKPPYLLLLVSGGRSEFVQVSAPFKYKKLGGILLNSANKIIKEITITKGLLNSSLTHPREVFRHAIVEHAASVILIHNHPSGNPEPSQEDISITKQIVEAGKVVGIPVHDHIIIAGGNFTSLAERGLI